MNNDRDTKKRPTMHWTGLMALGTLIPASVGAGAFLGWWLDGKLSTAPWFLIAGAALGAWAAFVQMMRMVRMTKTDGE